MRRRLFNLAAVVSLVMCVATIALWARSYLTADLLIWSHARWCVMGQSGGGQFEIEVLWPAGGGGWARPGWEHTTDKIDDPIEAGMRMHGSYSHFHGGGFWFVTGERWGDEHCAQFVPSWFALASTLVLPSIWLLRRPRRPVKAGSCRRCGYDLRATPDRCPECGTAVSAAPGAVAVPEA